MTETIDTLIVGGGQAGLALSYCLKQRAVEHLALERAEQLGHAWRAERWDSFTLVTPNWTWRLPGDEYTQSDPDGFMSRAEIVTRLEQYAARHALPVRCGVSVTAVRPRAEGGFDVDTSAGAWRARRVVMATGLFQRPRLPEGAARLPAAVQQLHSTQYRRSEALPPGAVLVVGSGQSGCQIAEELYQAGRTVYLSTGTCGRAPRRYRGQDVFAWLKAVGMLDQPAHTVKDPRERFAANPHVSGKGGGHSLNLHQFARDGVRLLGRWRGAEDGQAHFAPNLHANLEAVDKFEAELAKGVNNFIAKTGLAAPEETLPVLRDGYAVQAPTALDLAAEGITSVIWSAGYAWDFSLVQAPIFDSFGYPAQTDGAAAVPGLFFLGLPYLRKRSSALFWGVGEDAEVVAEKIKAEG